MLGVGGDSLAQFQFVFFLADDHFGGAVYYLDVVVEGRGLLCQFLARVERRYGDVSGCFLSIVLLTTALGMYSIVSTMMWAFDFSNSVSLGVAFSMANSVSLKLFV